MKSIAVARFTIYSILTLLAYSLLYVVGFGLLIVGLLCGKRPIGAGHDSKPNDWQEFLTDCNRWPKMLHIGDVRILPWHILLFGLTDAYIIAPSITGEYVMYTVWIAAILYTQAILLHILHKFSAGMGRPLPTDLNYRK